MKNQVTCKECCEQVHQHPRRANYKPLSTDSQPLTVPVTCVDNDQDIHNKSFSSDHKFFFLDPPSLNEAFDYAAKIATLAECFSLTKFNDFQKLIVDNTLAGHDSIVFNQQEVACHYVFSFHQFLQTRRP